MTQAEFLSVLRRQLAALPQAEVDDIVADYTMHFADGAAAGRSEEDLARALGDPVRLARELRAEANFKRWEEKPSPGTFATALFGFFALIAVDFVLLLPVLAALTFFTLVAGIVAFVLCLAGLVALVTHPGDFFTTATVARTLRGLAMLGFGVGGGALLVMLVAGVMSLLSRFARLHYTVLNKADLAT